MTTIVRVATLGLVSCLAVSAGCSERTLSEPIDTVTVVPPPTKPQRTQAEWDFWPWDAVRFSGPTSLGATIQSDSIAARLNVSLTARPSASDSVHIEYGSCAFGIRLYRDEALTYPPAWDNRLPPNAGCLAVLISHSVRAATPLSRQVGTIRPATLSDSLAAGRYWAAIAMKVNGGVQLVPAGAVDIIRP